MTGSSDQAAADVPAGDAATRSLVTGTAAAAGGVALIAIAILFLVTYFSVASGLRTATAAGVDADLAGLVDVQATGGTRELVARLADRTALSTDTGAQPHYLLLGDGRRLAGDLARWPGLSAARSEQGYVSLPGDRPAYGRATRLSPTLALFVSREVRSERETLWRLQLAFLAVGAAILLTVYAISWSWSRQLGQRVSRINAAYRVGGDDAIAGLIAAPARDEIGELSRRSGRALERLRRLVQSQRQVSDHIAHELRTPLLHLDGRLRTLLDQHREPSIARLVALASDDIRSIIIMLESLLDIAASEADRGDRSGLRQVDLSRLITDLADVYSASMEEAGLTFAVDIVPGVAIAGDPTQLGRLFANLLDNAVKYVPRGGAVTLSVVPGPVVVVADTGPGVPAELRERIFDRFCRGPDVDGTAGHGLGLALARAIALRHDLSLTLRDSLVGARFVLQSEKT